MKSATSPRWLPLAFCLLGVSPLALAAVTPPAADPAVRARPFVEGIISTPESFGASFSPDGRSFYFSRALPPRGLPTLMCSHLRNGQWTEPEIVPIEGASGEGDAALSPDGSRLFFWSRRSVPGKPAGPSPIPDLWFVDQRNSTFGPPRSVGETDTATWTPLTLRHGGPSVAADGTLYAFRGRAATGGQPQLVRAPLVGGRYAAFEDLGEALNANGGGFDPYVAPDQRYLVFSSDRIDSHGNADLYLSLRAADGSWSTPRNLGPAVNSDAAEYEAAFSPDGQLLVFTRDRRGIFVIETAALGLDSATRAVIEPARRQQPSTREGDSPEPVASLFAEGIISTPNSLGTAFSPDGQTVYFTRLAGTGEQRRGTLMTSHCAEGVWSEPMPLPFSGQHNDFDPGLSPDGTQLFYSSVRPDTGRRPTLWMVTRTAEGWSTPQHLAAITGDDGVAVYPSVAANGNLYFAGHRPGLTSIGDDDIYVCRRQPDGSYAEPENLGPAVNSPAQDYDAFVSPDESFLIFCSRRPGGMGRSDFYVSVRENGAWSEARHLGPQINSASVRGVCCPSVSPDRQWFYFTSSRNERPGIYRIEFKALGLPARSSAADAPDAVRRPSEARMVSEPHARGIDPVRLGPLQAPLHPAPSAGTWTRLPDLPTARLAAGAVALDGKLYVIGGCIVRDGAVHPIAAVEVYSPASGTWTTRAPLPTPRSNFGLAVADGRIFVIGGTLADNLSETDVVEAYDPVADRWTRVAPLPTPRCQVGAAAIGGKLYAIGGNRRHERAFEVYDPATNRWAELPALSAPRRDAGVAVVDGKIYVAVGLGPDARNPLTQLQVYDPATQQWSERASANGPRCDTAVVALGSTLVAVGGWNRGPIASVEEYVPARDRWTAREDLPVATQFHCAAALDGKLYVFTGTHRLPMATSEAWVWSPAADGRL